MDQWQVEHIIKNLPQLISLTDFNSDLKAELLANNVLSQAELENMEAERDRKGKSSASYHYYQLLMTRTDAYTVLTTALIKNNQTGASNILMSGIRNFGMPENFNDFGDMEIEVSGKRFKLHEYFPTEKLKLAQDIFCSTMSALELHDSFVKKKKTFVLATNNIPPEPAFYVPRFLSNRIEIDESVFKAVCSDAFVFRNNIGRLQLTEIARPNFTATSSTQLRNITARFIHLDDYEDWNEMKNSAKVPIHLISYDNDQKIYILEDSSATLDILSKIGSKNQRTYMSEDEFVQQQLSKDWDESSVCICDTPGMGKTFLLANIARLISKHCTGTIFAFIQLSTFVAEFPVSPNNDAVYQETALLNILKYVSPSHENAETLFKLAKAKLLRVEIFFDGFDEIPLNKVKLTKQVFLSIISMLRNVRIYITSRPHMRHELEKSLGVIAYDILPFNLQNQVNYLVRFWSHNVSNLPQTELSNYALKCLKEINKNLTRNDKEMAGIPLLCRLIAEVYSNKIHFFLTNQTTTIDFPFKIAAMYQRFIEQRFKATTATEEEINNIELIHIWYALKLLFPADGFHNDEIFKPVNKMMASSAVFTAGIIQQQSNTQLEFLHRTFAEYFAANYFLGKLQSTELKPRTFVRNFFNLNEDPVKLLLSIFNLLMAASDEENIFVHSVILSFADFNLNEVKISEQIMNRLAYFCASLSRKNFFTILCSCCRHNFYNLFCLLKKAFTEWNWFQKKMYFTTGNCFRLLSVCIEESTSQMFHSCIHLFKEVLILDMEQIAIYEKKNTLLHIAARAANYEAVEYFLDRVSLQTQQGVLEKCVQRSYDNDSDMLKRRENILDLLHNKNPTLIQETSDILITYELDLRFFKVLVKLGANLTAVRYDMLAFLNCAMSAARFMSPIDYHELVQFLLTECKADYLFVENEKWKDPLPWIIRWATLLPETLELLLNFPGININMKDRWGDNLLFSAAEGNKVDNLRQLVDRGLDYTARGRENRSLLHVAAWRNERVEMVRYLLSLKLDPNSTDKNGWTPLHYAADYENSLSVVEVLVGNGADVQAKDIRGQTALHLSAANYRPSIEVIKYLIGKGAGVNDRDNDGNTPLHLCKKKEAKDCLTEMGAYINAKNYKGQTPAQKNPKLFESSNWFSALFKKN